MLTLTNPGIYSSSSEGSDVSWVLFSVLATIGFVLIVLSIAAGAEELIFVGLVFIAIGGFLPMLSTMPGAPDSGETKFEYTAAVQVWLAGDYGIAINEEDATKLIDGDELALTVDGTATAIEIIEGEKGTIAVKVVGGSILQPSASEAPVVAE